MSSPSPKIAIIGGGLGGLSTLLSLLKNDFTNVTCYERDQVLPSPPSSIVLVLVLTQTLSNPHSISMIE